MKGGGKDNAEESGKYGAQAGLGLGDEWELLLEMKGCPVSL